ncbi:MAG: DUF2189 domain-containing protein [Alphaproteobacteria bacterium]|jgi:uncharacterized membrane protein|nr:DUF2189 domain-containing protein [Kiloniellales bacterium]MDX1486459.1 DUF2189 domain-containing protein [Alphaproteobacteria bacterium]
MANEKSISGAGVYRSAQPTIHDIGATDLLDALAKGIHDFKAMPTHLVHFCWIYPVVILIGARSYAGGGVLPLAFPLLAGYTLIGPLVATGMYELSRRRELGMDISRWHAFEVVRSPSIGSIAVLGILLMAIYFAWLLAAGAIYHMYFGEQEPASVLGFIDEVLTTSAGWGMIIVGCGVGFIFAAVVFALSVMSFPMLLDRDVGAMTAITTSVRAVMKNPLTMSMWAFLVAISLLLGSIPLFVGLAIVMPVLGHATWHLYRKTVEP